MSAASKPYTVTTYDLIDRTAKPPTVKPGREYSRHTTKAAARKAAKAAPDACLMDGPKSIAVLAGPGMESEVWWRGQAASQRGRTVTLSLRPYLHRGGFVVVGDAVGPAPDLSPPIALATQ